MRRPSPWQHAGLGRLSVETGHEDARGKDVEHEISVRPCGIALQPASVAFRSVLLTLSAVIVVVNAQLLRR